MKGYPSRYVVFDTETVPNPSSRKEWDTEQTLRLGVAKVYDPVTYGHNGPVIHEFRTSAEFGIVLKMMPYDKEKIYIFAHNIGFDLRIVEWFRAVAAGDWSLFPPPSMPGAGRYKSPLFVCDGHPTLMRFFRPDGQQFFLLDSFNWFPAALARVGEWLGFEKGQMPAWEAPDDEWFEYCKRDVDVLDRALRHLWGYLQCLRCPAFDATPAGQARSLYRMRYEKKRIVIPADSGQVALDRHAYYGGLIECFRIGRIDRQLYQVDVNGLYPRVMSDNLYPTEVKDAQLDPTCDAWQNQVDPREATAEVWLDSPETPWPVRTALGTLWCRGKVRTVLCGPELDAAVAAGVVRKLGRYVTYRLDDLFSAYVRYLWDARTRADKRGDALISKLCKQLLNALHGKFGQRSGEWEYRGRTETPGSYLNGRVIGDHIARDVDARVLDGHMFHRVRNQEHERSFVPIAAWTASYGRMYMDEIIASIGRDEVVYQCVDSLIVTGDGLGRLQLAGMVGTGELGHFKLEDTYTWVDFQSINQLDHDHGHRHSGIKSGSAAVAAGIYEVEEWQSLHASIFEGHVSSASIRRSLRRHSTAYYRRFVAADGSTIPWGIDNWNLSPERQSELNLDHATGRRA